MTRQVVFRPEAEDEVLEAREWYETRRSGLGREFAEAVDEIVSRIVENPLAYQRAHKELGGRCSPDFHMRCTTGLRVMTSLFRLCTDGNTRFVGNRGRSLVLCQRH